jgi:hypothetical protein
MPSDNLLTGLLGGEYRPGELRTSVRYANFAGGVVMRRVIALSMLAAAVAGVAACGSDSGGGGTSSSASGSANADKHVNTGAQQARQLLQVHPDINVIVNDSDPVAIATEKVVADLHRIGARAAAMMLGSNTR